MHSPVSSNKVNIFFQGYNGDASTSTWIFERLSSNLATNDIETSVVVHVTLSAFSSWELAVVEEEGIFVVVVKRRDGWTWSWILYWTYSWTFCRTFGGTDCWIFVRRVVGATGGFFVGTEVSLSMYILILATPGCEEVLNKVTSKTTVFPDLHQMQYREKMKQFHHYQLRQAHNPMSMPLLFVSVLFKTKD